MFNILIYLILDKATPKINFKTKHNILNIFCFKLILKSNNKPVYIPLIINFLIYHYYDWK